MELNKANQYLHLRLRTFFKIKNIDLTHLLLKIDSLGLPKLDFFGITGNCPSVTNVRRFTQDVFSSKKLPKISHGVCLSS